MSGLKTYHVLDEVLEERRRQDVKWGEQRDIQNVIRGYDYAISPARFYQDIEQTRAEGGRSTWTDILLEEVAEAIDEAKAGDIAALRKELVQVAAVAVNWVENIDRQS